MTQDELKAAAPNGLPSELLSDPKRWCKGTAARDKDGYIADPRTSRAVSFCALGACEVLNKGGIRLYDFVDSVADFNDTHTHEEVLALLRKAGL